MKNLNLDNKKLILFSFVALWLASFLFTFAQTSFSDLPEGVTQNQVTSALSDLSTAYGNPVENVDDARDICNSEQFIVACAEIGKRYSLYEEGEVSQVDALLEEIKGDVSQSLAQCTTAECLLNVAKQLSERIVGKNPQLASRLDLTSRKIEEKRAVIEAAKEVGVDFQMCRNMDPDTAPVDLLRSCARLAKDSRVEKFVPKGVKERVNDLDSTLALRDSLDRKEFSCGSNTLEGCGDFCLNPANSARAQGISAIPVVCRQIAERFFGPEGVKSLEAAYLGVNSAADYYYKKTQNIVFTTHDGTILSDPAQIGRYLEDQGRLGNVNNVDRGLGFMVSNGFVSQEEKEFALKMIGSIKDRGVTGFDFDMCRRDPGACADFIPQEYRREFESVNKVRDIMAQKLGFDPVQCERAAFDESVRSRCFEAVKNALPELEDLSTQSLEAQRIIAEIREHTRQGEAFDQSRQTIQQQGGPGGCRSPQECFAYCSSSDHGPECLSFGAKQGIFRGDDIAQRYQEYQDRRVGPYPGFQPPGQGEFLPPGQIPGFTQPGQGFGPVGPSPECFRAIQSGDFVKAKEFCYVPPAPRPIDFPQPQPTVCPSMPTVSECPAGQVRYVVYSSAECGQYYGCKPSGEQCPQGQYWNGTACVSSVTACPSNQYWNGTACVNYSTDPKAGCVQAGGTWDAATNYCNMPGTNCSSGQYWDYNTKACKTYDSPSGQKQQTWNTLGLSSQIRADADPARIEQLKQACANVKSGSNIWMPGAGDYSSPDFGMPSAEKCRIASSCSTTQYFDGASCVSSAANTTCPSGQWWDSATQSCKTSTTGGTGCGSNTAQASQSACLAISGCRWDNNACSPSSASTTCPSGQWWNGTACVNTTTTDCPSGQYWYTPPSGGAGYCQSMSTSCTQAGGTWDSSTNSCQMPTCPSGQYWYTPPSGGTGSCVSNTSTSCPSGQYWNGSSCVTTTTHDCPSGQYWDGSSCVSSTTTTCSSDQYWNGSACVSNTSTSCPSGQHMESGACVADPTATPTPTQDPATMCAQSGGSWDGSTCVMPTPPPPTSININFFLAQITQILKSLLTLLSNNR
ncbi:MAG: hypothetical protein HYT35_00475 [Candidatus Staskawiczbacteria bacterium]|nr:hypothetical protein [Candidatus Staskawiczbacteria bacterium]